MEFAFDLISDLHVEPDEEFNWSGQQTALYCVVAGDVARDRETVLSTLRHISSCYLGTLYIDGNDEHRDHLNDLDDSYQELVEEIKKIPGVIYLQNNVVIIDGIAFVGTNGWWCYNFDPQLDFDNSVNWFCEYADVNQIVALDIATRAYQDAAYVTNSVTRLQKHPDVKAIVLVTHTVPAPWLTSHDTELRSYYRYNGVGNQHMMAALNRDPENKIKMWCFGHYHRPIDRDEGDIQFISNPRGRPSTPWCQNPYYPKRIEINLQVR